MHVISLAGIGNCKVTCRALDQAHTQAFFQLGDAAAKLRFRHAQGPGLPEQSRHDPRLGRSSRDHSGLA
ncbi:MAG: hypothetical protein V9E86_08995 [Nitrosomonas sp.]